MGAAINSLANVRLLYYTTLQKTELELLCAYLPILVRLQYEIAHPHRNKKQKLKFLLSDFKNGKFSERDYEKRKLTAGDSALVFTKDLEISLFGRFGHWTTVSDCEVCMCVRINQLSDAKLLLHPI